MRLQAWQDNGSKSRIRSYPGKKKGLLFVDPPHCSLKKVLVPTIAFLENSAQTHEQTLFPGVPRRFSPTIKLELIQYVVDVILYGLDLYL